MKLKKIITSVMMLGVLATSLLFAAGSKKDIDKFLKSYEEFVVKTEKAAKKNDLVSLQKRSIEAVEFSEKVENLMLGDGWTSSDLKKYTDLTNRYTASISKIYDGVSTDTSSLYNFSY